jgi:hypothetical protein
VRKSKLLYRSKLEKLSDLVPDYLDDPKLFLFASPDRNFPGDVDLMAHRELIDMFSAYGFLRLPDYRLVVFERPGFRRGGDVSYIIQGNDGQSSGYLDSCHASPKVFTQQLGKGFPDVPHDEDYQNLYDSGLGPYWYELDIRGKKLQSIHSVFLASGKPPITSDAARAKVQAAMDKLGPPGTWLAEKGIKASDGSTPSYYFRCDYIKDPEKTNPLATYVLFDGTVLVPRKVPR